MSLINTARAVANVDLQSRVRAAMVVTAIDIQNDSTVEMGSPRHAATMQVLQSPDSNAFFTRFLWLVASNPTVSASVDGKGAVGASDSDVQYVVAGVWEFLFPKTR